MRKLITALFAIFILFSCQKSSSNICDDSVNSLYKSADFPVGASVNVSLLQSNAAYRNIVINQYNVITPEISSAMFKIEPYPGNFDFSELDYLVDFCTTYHKHLRGSALIGQIGLPYWLMNFNGDEAAWENIAKTYIQTVLTRYKGIVESWMFENEVLNEDGTLKNTIWQQHIGVDYLEKFAKWEHDADPDAVFFYNDYDLESNPTKLNGALSLADLLRSKGNRIVGIGFQMHIYSNYPDVDEIDNAALKVANRDYKVYYSEWDISSNPFGNLTSFTPAMAKQQKYIVKNVVRGYKELPVKYQYGISFWNVGDSDSWIRSSFHRIDWPLMFDDQYKPKPAYCGFLEALNEPL